MTLPQRYTLTVLQGSTLKRWFRLTYKNGTIVNLADAGDGYTIGRLTARDIYGGTELFTLTTDNGGIDLTYQADSEGAYWTGFIYMSADATSALEDWGDGVYDLEISDGIDVMRIIEGPVRLSRESTVIE